jgi:hypothetical protein
LGEEEGQLFGDRSGRLFGRAHFKGPGPLLRQFRIRPEDHLVLLGLCVENAHHCPGQQDVPRQGGEDHGNDQSMGVPPWAVSNSFTVAKCPQPMKPLWADRGEGWGAFRM